MINEILCKRLPTRSIKLLCNFILVGLLSSCVRFVRRAYTHFKREQKRWENKHTNEGEREKDYLLLFGSVFIWPFNTFTFYYAVTPLDLRFRHFSVWFRLVRSKNRRYLCFGHKRPQIMNVLLYISLIDLPFRQRIWMEWFFFLGDK